MIHDILFRGRVKFLVPQSYYRIGNCNETSSSTSTPQLLDLVDWWIRCFVGVLVSSSLFMFSGREKNGECDWAKAYCLHGNPLTTEYLAEFIVDFLAGRADGQLREIAASRGCKMNRLEKGDSTSDKMKANKTTKRTNIAFCKTYTTHVIVTNSV